METPRPSWSSAAKIGRKRMLNKIIKLAAAGLAFTLASAQAAHADYPERAVTVVVPFSAGGNTDTIARIVADHLRSEEHTSELQSLMRISYAVFCLKKKNKKQTTTQYTPTIYQVT